MTGTWYCVCRVRSPVLGVVALLVTVLHLQGDGVSSGQLRGQVCAAFRISGQSSYDLSDRVLTSPGRFQFFFSQVYLFFCFSRREFDRFTLSYCCGRVTLSEKMDVNLSKHQLVTTLHRSETPERKSVILAQLLLIHSCLYQRLT